ncbi:MAG: methionine--tRNA ligase [bacterium]|nr:methionine--tRNA ligase [bacterium]
MSRRRFLITAGLPYSNGRLHVGHVAGAYLPADTFARYLRARGDEVLFVCGSDDNGVASLISARKEGRSVQELTAEYNQRQRSDFERLGIRFDVYGGTHQPEYVEMHEKISQEFFRVIHEHGHFVKRTTEQLYDVEAQQFLPDRFVKGTCYHTRENGSPCGYDGAYGDQCESCGNAIDPMLLVEPQSTITGSRPESRSTTHWYMKLGDFDQPLREWLTSNRTAGPDRPAWRDTVLNFALGQLQEGLPERPMTRDLDWGVPVPLDDPDAEGKVLYVWFDAPIGYVSFTATHCQRETGDWKNYERWWKDEDSRVVHFIGEDNTVFHALTWPAMILAEGSHRLPSQVVSNAFLNIKLAGGDETKIGKTKVAIWIEDYLKHFDADPLRYYLTAIAPETRRTAFDADDFVARNNGELLNALGNFINRTLTFTEKYFEGSVPEPGDRTEVDLEHLNRIGAHAERVTEQLEAFHFKAALEEVMALARASNGYLDTKQPWKQRKEDMAACGTTLNICLQTVKALATLMAPFLPAMSEKCGEMLKVQGFPWLEVGVELPPGHELGESGILVRKLEADEAGRL